MTGLPSIFPNGAQGAISLTYDDSLASHLEIVLPDLEAADLRGTFFVPTRHARTSCFETRKQEWLDAERRGHELGNHTQYHPCRGERSWLKPNFSLDAYNEARMEAELRGANRDLDCGDQSARPRSFAYPCCDDRIGPDLVSYRPMVNRLFVAARGGREPQLVNPFDCDFSYIPAWIVPHSASPERLIDFAKEASAQQRWAVLCFHDIGTALPGAASRDHHRDLLLNLATNREQLWCSTFLEVATHIRKVTNRPWK